MDASTLAEITERLASEHLTPSQQSTALSRILGEAGPATPNSAIPQATPSSPSSSGAKELVAAPDSPLPAKAAAGVASPLGAPRPVGSQLRKETSPAEAPAKHPSEKTVEKPEFEAFRNKQRGTLYVYDLEFDPMEKYRGFAQC